MTRYPISTKTGDMGRRKRNYDKMPAGFDAGTFDRMDPVRAKSEDRKQFLRTAVNNEIQRRLADPSIVAAVEADLAAEKAKTAARKKPKKRPSGPSS